MVRDGYYYAFALAGAAALLVWLAGGLWAIPPLLLAGFFLWFFRDPERVIPSEENAIVSPADGRVTDVSPVTRNGTRRTRISIVLNVVAVHVNRSPIAGVISSVRYLKGKFLNALNAAAAEYNEQNIVPVDGEGQQLEFRQIAGLLARRVVFVKQAGDPVQRGERVGMMKFGSRMDVLLDPEDEVCVRVGDRVTGGSSILAIAAPASSLSSARAQQGRAAK